MSGRIGRIPPGPTLMPRFLTWGVTPPRIRFLPRASRLHAGVFVLGAVAAVVGCACWTAHSLAADRPGGRGVSSEPQSAATSNAAAMDAEPPLVDSSSLPDTIVTPHMEQPIVPGKNILYCSTFQLAWISTERCSTNNLSPHWHQPVSRRVRPPHQGTLTGRSRRWDARMMGKCARRWKATTTSLSVMAMSAGVSIRSRKIWRAWASA
jgi:hypothetical protein